MACFKFASGLFRPRPESRREDLAVSYSRSTLAPLCEGDGKSVNSIPPL